MAHQAEAQLGDTGTTLGSFGTRVFAIAGLVGLVALAVSFVLGQTVGDGMRQFLYSYLVNFAFFLSISLGALIFVPLQHVTRSSWSVVIRRLAEVMAVVIPLFALLALPILLNLGLVYQWASGNVPPELQELLAHKAAFLNPTFFIARWIGYFAIWTGLAFYFWRTSVRQDSSAEVRLSLRMENYSGATIVVFALTCTLASMDLLMTLDFAWFSTIFGVYFFSTAFVTFFATLTLLTMGLQRSGRLERIVSAEHFHDYGKLMFAFTFFWAYIAFSQYMLYWYANVPEETIWFLVRSQNGWGKLGLVLVFGTFLLPFLGLISRYAKRNRKLLALWAIWILIMQWINIYWVTMPVFSPERVAFHVLDLSCFIGIGGIWLAGVTWLAAKHSLVPTGDPRLRDSLKFENA